MRNFLKIMKSGIIGGMCFALIGCTPEESGVTLEGETTSVIGQEVVTDIKEVEKKTVEVKHIVNFNGMDLTLKPNYAIEKTKAENWYFTQSSTIDLGLNIESIPDNYKALVSQVYADISLISPYANYNGIRQDSMNIEYFPLPNGGISINQVDGIKIPFQIEAVDKNETFFYMWNGYGSSSTSRITESDLAEVAEGAVLNVVWTVLFENEETGEQFVKTINDRIGIPYNRASQSEE